MLNKQNMPYPFCLGDRLMVTPLEVDTNVRGMIRPGAKDERPSEGIVVLRGPGRVTEFGNQIEPSVELGDLISFPSYAGKEVVDPRGFEPGVYLIVREGEVLINYGPHGNYLIATAPKEEE